MTHYTKIFKTLVESASTTNEYIGSGNPNGKILIIGKEVALDEANDNPIIQKTIVENAADWNKNIQNPLQDIENCEDNVKISLCNPFFPYKRMKQSQQSPGHTWRKYQYFYESLTQTKSEYYSFLDFCFITELNANPSKTSREQDKILRAKSIQQRLKEIFKSDFIQNFPIVILACGHYQRENDIDICSLFNVDYFSPVRYADNNKKQWYNLHFSKDERCPKLVIHTRHLSMNASKILLKTIANEVLAFCNKNNIHI